MEAGQGAGDGRCGAAWRAGYLGAVLLLLGTTALWLYSSANDFPYYYHPAEPSKVEQLLNRERNWRHPQLLLTATEVGQLLHGPTASRQALVRIGRWTSAVFAAAAVVALALLASLRHGIAGAACAGTLTLLTCPLLVFARYMKEDPGLLLGIALSLLALSWFRMRRTIAALVLLGAVCGFAVSAKYPGAVTALPALLVVWLTPVEGRPDRRLLRVAWFLGGFLAVALLLNYALFLHSSELPGGIGRELNRVVSSHEGLKSRASYLEYLDEFVAETTPLTRILLAAHLAFLLATYRERTLPEWVVTLFPFGFALLISFFPVTAGRYFLPVTVLTSYLAGVAIVEWMGRIPWARLRHGTMARPALTLGLLALAAGGMLPRFVAVFHEVQGDSHRELLTWIRQHLPENAVIARDSRVHLPLPGSERYRDAAEFLPQQLVPGDFVGSVAGIEELRRQGVTHVAVCRFKYGRFFQETKQPTARYQDGYERTRLLYEELFARGELLWSSGPRIVQTVQNPEIRLYRLPAPIETAAAGTPLPPAPGR